MRETLLYVAPSARKSAMLDEKLIRVTRDMTLEAISRVLTARLSTGLA